jgi:hypothetical protein
MRLTVEQILLRCLEGKMPQNSLAYMSVEEAYEELKRDTGQDFGYDVKAWKQWFKTADDPFPNLGKSKDERD